MTDEPNPMSSPTQSVAVVLACPPEQLDAYFNGKPAVAIFRTVPVQSVDFYAKRPTVSIRSLKWPA